MSLGDHLRELRRRVILAALGIGVGSAVGWLAYEPVFQLLQAPVVTVGREAGRRVVLNFAGVATSFDMQIKVSVFIGVIVASPWWAYQLWAFVNPGLRPVERRYTAAYLGAGVPLFCAGAAVAWWLLPQAVGILTGFTPEGAVNYIDAQSYLTFVMRMVLAFGLAFLLPVLMVALNAVGVVRARTWWSGWRWAVVVGFVFAAVATPTGDVVSMMVLGIPVCALYFAAAGLCTWHDRRRGVWDAPAGRRRAAGADRGAGTPGEGGPGERERRKMRAVD